MEKILFLATILLFATNTSAQNNLNSPGLQNLDINGFPCQSISTQKNAPVPEPSILTAYSYDSVRALTEINNPIQADAYPWISPDGLRLYYTSGTSVKILKFTQRPNTNSNFGTPTTISIPSVPSATSYWFSSDELDLYICKYPLLLYTHRNSILSPFSIPDTIDLTGAGVLSFFAGASLNAAQDKLFLYSVPLGLIELSRTSPTSFAYERSLSVPFGYDSKSGQLSKDELTFFFTSSYNSGNSQIYQLTRTNPMDSFAIGTFEQVQNISDSSVFNTQPSMSDNLDWVVFVRSVTDSWSENELFIAHKGVINSVFAPTSKEQTNIIVYPNPATDFITIETSDLGTIELYNATGQLIWNQTTQTKLLTKNIADLPSGVYNIRFIYEGGSAVKPFVVRQ